MHSGSFLAALQLADSALPIGRFAHSHGLESLLAEAELVEDELLELVGTAIAAGVAPLDGVAVAEAHRRAARDDLAALLELDAMVTARKLAPGARAASHECGRRLAALGETLTAQPIVCRLAGEVRARRTDGNVPVVVGTLALAFGLRIEEAVLIELRGAASSLLSAAVRLGRLSASRAQVLLRRLEPVVGAAAGDALARPPEAMTSTALELEIHALRHRRADARLFMS
jgi:urease accessory protein